MDDLAWDYMFFLGRGWAVDSRGRVLSPGGEVGALCDEEKKTETIRNKNLRRSKKNKNISQLP